MKKVSLSLTLVLVLLAAAQTLATAADTQPDKYYVGRFDGRVLSTETYKGWPINWWATYFIKEFDIYAKVNGEAGGMDWLHGAPPGSEPANGFRGGIFGPAPDDWLDYARRNDWIIEKDPAKPMVGALGIISVDNGLSIKMFIVHELRNGKIRDTALSSAGVPADETIPVDQLNNLAPNRKFIGYIYPTKRSTVAPAGNASTVEIAKDTNRYFLKRQEVASLSTDTYKDWPVNWWATYFIKEFDVYAATNGISGGADWLNGAPAGSNPGNKYKDGWFGPMSNQWPGSAAFNGWVVEPDPYKPMVGAIAVMAYDNGNGHLVIIREIKNDAVRYTYMNKDGVPTEETLTLAQLANQPANRKFVGYIYPVKKQ